MERTRNEVGEAHLLRRLRSVSRNSRCKHEPMGHRPIPTLPEEMCRKMRLPPCPLLASQHPERRHSALRSRTRSQASRPVPRPRATGRTCSRALHSRRQRCVHGLFARVVNEGKLIVYITGHLRFTTLDTKAYEASATCNEFSGDGASGNRIVTTALRQVVLPDDSKSTSAPTATENRMPA